MNIFPSQPRDQFISKLLKKLKTSSSGTDGGDGDAATAAAGDEDEDEEDSWERLADEEVDEIKIESCGTEQSPGGSAVT